MGKITLKTESRKTIFPPNVLLKYIKWYAQHNSRKNMQQNKVRLSETHFSGMNNSLKLAVKAFRND